jgi:hypothetical protein
MSGDEEVPRPEPEYQGEEEEEAQEEQQQDQSQTTLNQEEPVVVVEEEEAQQEPEPTTPAQPTPAPIETPSTSNNALIMQIKILQEYAKDIKRSMNAVATTVGVHHEYVRRAVRNLVTAVVEHNGDIERLQEIYSEGNYSLRPRDIQKLLILVDNLVNKNQSTENFNDNRLRQNRSNEGSINRHYNNNSGNRRMRNNSSPFDYYGYGQQQQHIHHQERGPNDFLRSLTCRRCK